MGQHDQILELAVDYALCRCYLLYRIVKTTTTTTTTTNRAVRKRASTLVVDKGEVQEGVVYRARPNF